MTTSSATIEEHYVLDTNSLIWYLKEDKKLSARASTVLAAAERGETLLIISSIVIAELYYANKKHKLFVDFAATYADLKSKPFFEFISFNPDDVLNFERDSAVPEMHDRIIAGLARRLGIPLITSDPLIIAANVAQIVW